MSARLRFSDGRAEGSIGFTASLLICKTRVSATIYKRLSVHTGGPQKCFVTRSLLTVGNAPRRTCCPVACEMYTWQAIMG